MASQREIVHETNARYWISTGYKMGERLDPKDPVDGMHARRWLEWYRDLVNQNAQGTLTLVHKDPSFARTLSDAINAARIERATREGDQRYADARRAKHQAMSDGAMWQDMILSRRTSQVAGWPWYGAPYLVRRTLLTET